MKILHLNNVANVAYELSRAQRKLGHQSDVLHFRSNRLGYQYDYFFDIERYPRWIYFLLRFYHQLKFMNYDVYHLHSSFLFPFYLDPLLLRPLGKKVFFHFHGSDIRLRQKEPFFARFAHACWASNPDLLKFFSIPVTLIPLSVNVDDYRPYLREDENEIPVLFHSASRPDFSGSDHVVEAVERLRERGLEFEFIHLKNASRQEYLTSLSRADIVIDKVVPTTGTYAMMALEAMSMKKVVCVNLTPESLRYLPTQEHPLVAVDPENLEERLGQLLERRDECRDLGAKSYEFVRNYHDSPRIAGRMIEMYGMSKRALSRTGPTLSYGD